MATYSKHRHPHPHEQNLSQVDGFRLAHWVPEDSLGPTLLHMKSTSIQIYFRWKKKLDLGYFHFLADESSTRILSRLQGWPYSKPKWLKPPERRYIDGLRASYGMR